MQTVRATGTIRNNRKTHDGLKKEGRKDNQPRVIHRPFLSAYHESAVLMVVHDPWSGKKCRYELSS